MVASLQPLPTVPALTAVEFLNRHESSLLHNHSLDFDLTIRIAALSRIRMRILYAVLEETAGAGVTKLSPRASAEPEARC